MPRKVSPGPPISRIESLSTGREIRPAIVGTDDFEQTVQIARVQDDSPVRELLGAQELRDASNRVKRITLQRIANDLFGPKPKAKPFQRRI